MALPQSLTAELFAAQRFDLPDDGRWTELVAGRVVALGPPEPIHGTVVLNLTKALGQHTCVLMRGHGSTVVAPSLERAVYRAVYAEENAKLQLTANALGPIEFLTKEEADLAMNTNEGQVMRPWELWSRSIGAVE